MTTPNSKTREANALDMLAACAALVAACGAEATIVRERMGEGATERLRGLELAQETADALARDVLLGLRFGRYR